MENPMAIKLTAITKGSGCGCKIPPGVLSQVLIGKGNNAEFPSLLVGFNAMDDAAAMALPDGQILLSTLDFFTPVSDDPYEFGQIAAANSISDIYAMGGKPLLATAILGFPLEILSPELMGEVISGAESICHIAGIPLAGGHSIANPEPFFGLSVNGLVTKSGLKKNTGALAGDHIYMTKPLGTGILNTAVKRGQLDPDHRSQYIQVMTTLNKEGSWFGTLDAVHAMTDITGFGLLGHLREMAEGSQLTAAIKLDAIPYFDFIEKYIQLNCLPDNTYRNWNAHESKVDSLSDMKWFSLLNDPQTNGGLLLAVAADFVTQFEQLAGKQGIAISCIGVFKTQAEKSVVFEF